MPEPGWYPDPHDPGHERWWDGASWTNHVRFGTSTMREQSAEPRDAHPEGTEQDRHVSRGFPWLLTTVVVLIALGVGTALGLTLLSDELLTIDPTPSVTATPSDEAPYGGSSGESPGPTEVDDEEEPLAAETPGGSTPTPATRPPERTPLSEDELANSLRGYIWALNSGDIDLAYDYVSPALRQRSGWSYDRFAAFRNDVIIGCEVVSIDAVWVENESGTVEATVDYFLPDGEVSHESIRTEFVRDPQGRLLLNDYIVLRATRR